MEGWKVGRKEEGTCVCKREQIRYQLPPLISNYISRIRVGSRIVQWEKLRLILGGVQYVVSKGGVSFRELRDTPRNAA